MKIYTIEEFYDYDTPSWEAWSVEDGMLWADKKKAEKYVADEIIRRAQTKFKQHTDLWDRHKVLLEEYEEAKKVLADHGLSSSVLSSRLGLTRITKEPVFEDILAKMQETPTIRVYEVETLD